MISFLKLLELVGIGGSRHSRPDFGTNDDASCGKKTLAIEFALHMIHMIKAKQK